MEIVQEFGELAPINLKEIGKISGQPIYSNKRSQQFIKDWLQRSPNTKKISAKIIEGMDSGRILMGYENTNKIHFLKTRWRDFRHDDSKKKGYLGYIDANDHKIAIVFDENVDLLGSAIRYIPHTITHELIHLTALDLWKPFITSTMKKWLIPFFTQIFNSLNMETKTIPERKLMESIIDVSRITDHNFHGRPDTQMVYQAWSKYLRNGIDGEDTADVLMQAFAPYYKYGMGNLKADKEHLVKSMILKFITAYNKIGTKKILSHTVPCQEMIYPSEIICMSNQFDPAPEVVKLINALRFPKVKDK